MLTLSRHPYSYIHINLREGAHRQPDYLVKNRFAQVPALRDGAIFLVQSAAILEYLSES
ncbi:MAG: glutathione S-transferase, partial [Brachymonas sp.]|nr:glutathione S-transferase [Brachymonas sp.]